MIAFGLISAALTSGVISCTDVLMKNAFSDMTAYPLKAWSYYACEQLSQDGTEVNLIQLGQKNDLSRVPTSAELEAKGKFNFVTRNRGTANIRWASLDDKIKVRIQVRYKLLRPVAVFNRKLSPYEDVSERHINIRKIDISRLANNIEPVDISSNNFVTRKQVRNGEIVTTANVTIRPLVYRNRNVKIRVLSKGINIEVSGIALKNGWEVGDLVSVRAEDASGPITAIVAGENIVDVHI